MTLSDMGAISTSALEGSSGDAGTVLITAADVRLEKNASISSSAEVNSRGRGGEVRIDAGSLYVGPLADISSSTAGSGDAGKISIDATTIVIDGRLDRIEGPQDDPSFVSTFPGQITSQALGGGGSAGNIEILAGQLSMSYGRIDTSAKTSGTLPAPAGTIGISARRIEATNFSFIQSEASTPGGAGDIIIQSDDLTLSSNSAIGTSSVGGAGVTGPAGSITILPYLGELSNDVARVRLAGRSAVRSNSVTSGDAGSVAIRSGVLELDSSVISSGTSLGGQGGSIDLAAGSMSFANGSEVSATAAGSGDAGSVRLTADRIEIERSQVSSSSSADGNAGQLDFLASSIGLLNGAQVTTDSALGPAGDISFTLPDTGRLVLSGELPAVITTTSGANSGGRISISSPYLILSDGGSILALGQQSGANVRISSDFFLRSADRPNDLSVNGSLVLDSQINDFSAITEAPELDFLDASSVLGGRCASVRSTGRTSTFVSRTVGPYAPAVSPWPRPGSTNRAPISNTSKLSPCG